MRYLFVVLIIILMPAFVLAQSTDAMLFGDVKTGEQHIPFAAVTVKGTTIGTAADATGHFKMTNIPLGKQVIVVSAIGYKPIEETYIFEKDKSITESFQLEPDNIGLEQVVVSADRNAQSCREAATIINNISAKLMKRTQDVNLSEGLSFTPGLRVEDNCQNCGFTQIRMNGMESQYTQILINSRPVFSGLAGVYGIELIPANMIERVEVVRGGGSAMYGSNAIAGTVNLITRDPVNNTFSAGISTGAVGFGLGDSSGGVQPDKSLNFNGSFVTDDFKSGLSIFGFHRKREPFDVNNDGFSDLTAINNTTLGTRLYHRLTERAKLTADYFIINEFRRGGSDFDLPPHEAMIAEQVRHQINSGSVNFDLLAREEDQFSVYFSGQKVNRQTYYGANQDPSAYGFTNDFTYSAGIQYSRKIGMFLFSPSKLTSGIEHNGSNLDDTKQGYYDYQLEQHFGNTKVAKQQLNTSAAFVQNEWNFSKGSFAAGLRYDHYVVADKLDSNPDITGDVFSPRVSLLYNIESWLQARAGFAGGFRAPQIFDEDLHIEASGARKVIHENAPGLKQETSKSITFSLDFTKDFGRWETQFLVEGFYTRLKNPFANEYGTPDENGTVVYTRINVKDAAIVQGVNLEFNTAPSALFQFQSGFTIQKAAYEEPQEFNEKRFFRSPDNYGFASLSYSLSEHFNLAFTGNYTGSMLVPYFGPTIADPDAGELRKTPTFFDSGIKLTYEFHLSDEISMELNSGMKNIFNSYQKDLDKGISRDPSYIYGPTSPRMVYVGLKIGNLL